MKPDELEGLMSEIEAGDPLDFSHLAIGGEDARKLMAAHFCELDGRLVEAGLDAEARLTVMAAIAAHTLQANFLGHLDALRARESFDLGSWMHRHGFGSPGAGR